MKNCPKCDNAVFIDDDHRIRCTRCYWASRGYDMYLTLEEMEELFETEWLDEKREALEENVAELASQLESLKETLHDLVSRIESIERRT